MSSFEMSWPLPTTLKEKLSVNWAKCLETLANSTFFLLSSYTLLEGRITNEGASPDMPCLSWESVLNILGEEDTVDQDGELKLLPVFSSLPPVMQLRFIFFLQSNVSKIASRSIHTFLQQIENSQNNMWMTEAISQLKNTVSQHCCQISNVAELKSHKYTFTSESQNVVQDLCKLMNRKGHPLQPYSDADKDKQTASISNSPTSKSSECAAVTDLPDLSVTNSNIKNIRQTLPCDDNAMDVIIIDDDSLNNVVALSPVNVNKNITMPTDNSCRNNFEIKKSDSVVHKDLDRFDKSDRKQSEAGNISVFERKSLTCHVEVLDKPNAMNLEQSLINPDIHNNPVRNDKLKGVKRKFTETFIQENQEHPVSKKHNFVQALHDINAVDAIAEMSHSPPSSLLSITNAADSEMKLPRNIMAYLDGIRETCVHKDNAGVFTKDALNCFLDMDATEIEVACNYLGLAQFSEKALLSFCDGVPWTSLGNELSSVLLSCCFSSKLTDLESPASRTLLMSLDSVSRLQPHAVINMLVRVLTVSESGEFQCQVLNSICKEFLPLDCFEHLIRQLSKEAIIINEHLVNVLQTLIDKCPNLTTESLNYFHSVLTTVSPELSTSVKFGKLLMGVLTRYREKLSSEQFTATCTLVETHHSSFRRPLLALVKRLTRV